jgi:hypothetical protein
LIGALVHTNATTILAAYNCPVQPITKHKKAYRSMKYDLWSIRDRNIKSLLKLECTQHPNNQPEDGQENPATTVLDKYNMKQVFCQQ